MVNIVIGFLNKLLQTIYFFSKKKSETPVTWNSTLAVIGLIYFFQIRFCNGGNPVLDDTLILFIYLQHYLNRVFL